MINTVKRDTAIVLAACHGAPIAHLLQNTLPTVDVVYLTNFKFINQKEPIPQDILRRASIFIYQPITNKEGYNTENWLEFISPSCLKICMPYPHWNAYFPTYYHPKESESRSPLKEYSHRCIEEFIHKNINLCSQELTQVILSESFLDSKFIRDEFTKTTNVLREKDRLWDISIVDFILENHRKKKLFYSVNHVSNDFYFYIFEEICERLNVEPFFPPNLEEFQGGVCDVILPSVAQALDLEFSIEEVKVYGKVQSAFDYIKTYVENIMNSFIIC